MNRLTSLYFDLLRILAAVGVLFVHCNLPFFSNHKFLPPELGHKLVMVFFVLSGYLIAYSTFGKDKGIKKYFVDRFSRLYSVVIPALLLTYALDTVSKAASPDLFKDISQGNQFIKAIINLLFLQQVWQLSTKPSSNGVFWSLSYEFWYYCLFAFFYYLRGAKRWFLLVLSIAIIGPKIMLLFPVWCYGVVCVYLIKKTILPIKSALIIFTASLAVILWLLFNGSGSDLSHFGVPPLYFSSLFLYDWMFGLLVAINLYAASYLEIPARIPEVVSYTVVYLASISFSLYLYHFPILIFASAVIPYDKNNYGHLYLLISGIILLIGILAHHTESKRFFFKEAIGKGFNFLHRKYQTFISADLR